MKYLSSQRHVRALRHGVDETLLFENTGTARALVEADDDGPADASRDTADLANRIIMVGQNDSDGQRDARYITVSRK